MTQLVHPQPPFDRSIARRDLLRDLRDLVGIFQRGWRYIAISMIICLTVSLIYLAKTRREFQSTARILVFQQGGRPINVSNTDPTRTLESNDDFVPTHMAIISSPVVVGRAIDIVGLENLPSLAGASNPSRAAIESLKVTRPDRVARVLQIDFRAWSAIEANRMVTAITESYTEFLADTFQKNNGEVVSLISKARDELSRELSALERQYVEFQRTHPILVTDSSGRTLALRRLDEWDRVSNEAMIRSVKLRGQLELCRKMTKEGVDPGAILQAINQLDSTSSDSSMRGVDGSSDISSGYLGKLIEEQQQLTEKFGPEYSRVKAIQDQIYRVLQRSREARGKYQGIAVSDLMTALEQGGQALEAIRVEYAKMLANDRDEAKKAEIDKLSQENLLLGLERNRTLFNTVVDQLKQAQFVSDYNSVSSHLIQPPSASGGPVSPRVTFTLGLAFVVGFFIGTCLSFAVDRLDPRIRTVEALRRALNFPLLGQVPAVPNEVATRLGEFGLLAHSMPRSAWSESFRAVRTNLDFIRRSRQVRVILVASPHSGDGKSVSSSNLAIVLAQAGRRVLLIDGDLRKPSLHRIHGFHNECGLTSILRDHAPAFQALHKTSVENLDLLTAGPQAHNPAELLSSTAMTEFLTEARESYDLIIMDSSPLLAVTDPGILGGLADGTMLVVRVGTLKHHEASVVHEQLIAMGTPVFGCLANGLVREHGGYGYGYGYGYGTPYGSNNDPMPPSLPGDNSQFQEEDRLAPRAEQNGFHS